MPIARRLLSLLIASAILTLRVTCRVRVHNDPRPGLNKQGKAYTYSVLHAHQISVLINREPGTAAMVSQSADGQLLIPAFWMMGVKPMRGSSGSNKSGSPSKGGRAALRGLADHLRTGKPAIIAVDGPRGPRGRVSKGVVVLAKQTGCGVLNTVAVPRRRWTMRKVWDRFQVPQPFTLIDGYFGEPLFYQPGESIEAFRVRVEEQLNALEAEHDPQEARVAGAATAKRAERKRQRPAAA